ncbi:NUDIX domain-containing protein [Paenibacillus nanensis]|uniref:NUDIX domain-containing protein n=1 Tax=Paenibacillus nanensis TaxID=393251 RepID=A0A3A1UYU4_9BACL|nr:NUDIX domain-containing protein [Paenibacillus nanensis]RIX53677.1 NUDIX domain-containing protein [Paenibacillus nanensis]
MNNEKYPTLANTIIWGPVHANFRLNDSVDETIVSNVTIIPFVGDKYVIFQVENGNWELPGGTLEAGENYTNALKREMLEELGGELIDYHIFGQFDCISTAEKPYKPHIPHPKFVRVVGYGEVKLVSKPLNPEGGEQVIAVKVVEIEEAVRILEGNNRYDIAELYKLAHELRS